jgi:hypothetical protein
MAFDIGFDFRSTAGYVTDPSYGDFVGPTDSYPTTYTNVDGFSINAGWETLPTSGVDISASNDPRIAGAHRASAGTGDDYFTVDLSSGSAPGAGDYTVDIALGGDNGVVASLKLYDDATELLAISGAINTNEFIDATNVKRTATTTWNGATVSKTFATTTCKILNIVSGYTAIAHFRLTLQVAGGAQAIFTQDHIGRGIGRGIFAGR